jgi:hypothetical protein
VAPAVDQAANDGPKQHGRQGIGARQDANGDRVAAAGKDHQGRDGPQDRLETGPEEGERQDQQE